MSRPSLLLLALGTVAAWQPLVGVQRAPETRRTRPALLQASTPPPEGEAASSDPPTPEAPTTPQSNRFDLKKTQDKSGAGFNQFDPVLSLSGFVSRRFGLAGGLAVVGLLAATEGNEIVKSLTDTGPQAGTGEVVTTASGLQYEDILVGTRGDTPLPGTVVGFNAVVSIGDKVLFDTRQDKPVAFKYGGRPFQSIVCEGVEEGLKGMKTGSKRRLVVPSALAPKGLELPAGVPIVYEIEVTEVLPGYF